MKISETPIEGARIVECEPKSDSRGSFVRTYCREAFQAAGMQACAAQSSVAVNLRQGTLRGMHYAKSSHQEAKLVSCVRGTIFDVLLDVRPGSSTFGRWFAVRLEHRLEQAVYVPPGVAHGYQTLTDDAAVAYQMSLPHCPEADLGIRWDDPWAAIVWPLPRPILSERDRSFQPFEAEVFKCAS